jgi:hypothetical protein
MSRVPTIWIQEIKLEMSSYRHKEKVKLMYTYFIIQFHMFI